MILKRITFDKRKKKNMNRLSFIFILFYIMVSDAFFFHLPQFNFNEVTERGINQRIDTIDDKLYNLIYERIELSKELKTVNHTIPQPCRQIYSLTRLRKKKLLDNTLVKSIWSLLYKESFSHSENDSFKDLYHLNETMEEGNSEIL